MAARILTAAIVVLTGVCLGASAAWAPSPVSIARERQIALGYRPCDPIVTQLPADVAATGTLADADNGEQSGRCEIRIAADLGDNDPDWIAYHEVCHLSTLEAIYGSGAAETLADPAHEHPLFRQCMRLGGWIGGY